MNLSINGTQHHLDVPPDARLAGVLRRELGLTGTKIGCGDGKCGACIVLLDGRPVRACVYPARRAEGKNVLTIEGLTASWGKPGELHPLQRAFIDHGAVQCGFCTPGLLMAAAALWHKIIAGTCSAIQRIDKALLVNSPGMTKSFEALMAVIMAHATVPNPAKGEVWLAYMHEQIVNSDTT